MNTAPRAHRRAWTTAGAVVIAIALLGAACSKSDSTAEGPATTDTKPQNDLEANDTPRDGGKLVMAVTAETNGWNPGTSQWAEGGNFVGSAMIEPLMVYDEKGGVLPWLADSVTPKTPGDFTTWTIKLKPNIVFHDGTKFDANAVKANFDLYRSDAALSGLALKNTYKDVKVIDALTVESDFTIPWASYPANLAGPNGFMMAPAQIADPDGKSHPIGTGPFQFVSWTPDSSLRAKKNPNYWRKGEPHLDEIEFRPITDAQARLTALRAGDLDMVLTRQAADISAMKDEFTVIADFDSEKTFVMLNTAQDPAKPKNPFTNIHARRALAYATDQKLVAQTAGGDQTLKTSTSPFVLNTQWELDDAKTGYYPYDPQKAKDEIEAYKKDTGEAGISFQLTGASSVDDQKIDQFLVEQWKQVGIDATIDVHDQSAIITQLVFGNFQAALTQNYAYIDPDFDWVFWHDSQANGIGNLSINFQQLKDKELTDAMDHARSTDDLEARKADYLKAAQRLNDQAVHVWLFNTPFSVIAAKNIRGLNGLRTNRWGNFLPHPWLWGSVWRQ